MIEEDNNVEHRPYGNLDNMPLAPVLGCVESDAPRLPGVRHRRNKRASLALCTSLLTSAQLGCAPTLAQMDPDRVIGTEDGFTQAGKRLDRADMLDRLKQEESAAAYAGRAQIFESIAQVLAGVGGALIGWPIGGAISGEDSPQWGLAYAGAGTALASIPLSLLGQSNANQAVEAHNAALEASSVPVPRASWRKPESLEPDGARRGLAAHPQVSFVWQF